VRAYADTSFLIKLVSSEPGSESAVAEYRRLQRPRLFYLPLHALEAENATRLKAFHLRRSLPSGQRGHVSRERDETLSRIRSMLDRNLLVEVTADWDSAAHRARGLSLKHTESLGARSLDLLHVAFALELECEVFFTTDQCQAQIAKAEGLSVVIVEDS
jgi:predicted nucleic acid-binding protein